MRSQSASGRGSRSTDVSSTSPRRPRRRGARLRHGRGRRRLRRRRRAGPVRHELRVRTALPQRGRRHLPRVAERRRRRPALGAGAAFVDYDRDGRLDLYVANYVDFRPRSTTACRTSAGEPDYCGPRSCRPDGRTASTATAATGPSTTSPRAPGIGAPRPGLGVVRRRLRRRRLARPLRRQRPDAATCCAQPRRRHLRGRGLLAGARATATGGRRRAWASTRATSTATASSTSSSPTSSGEAKSLYRGEGGGFFKDGTVWRGSGTAEAALASLGFGVRWLDVDNDGRARSAGGQRRGAQARRALVRARRSLSAAAARPALPQPRRRPLRPT